MSLGDYICNSETNTEKEERLIVDVDNVKASIQELKKVMKHNKVNYCNADSKLAKGCFKAWNDCLRDVAKDIDKIFGKELCEEAGE